MIQFAPMPRDYSEKTSTVFGAAVKQAFSSQATLLGRGEHCSVDPERLALFGLVRGSQIRVRRNARELALFTVSETRGEPDDRTVRMAPAARQRLGTEYEFDAVIDTRAALSMLSDEEAEAQSEFVERLDDNGCNRSVIVLAPHGGAIERHTDQQAERVAALLGGDRASSWRCKGFKAGGGAFERWHITATDIHESSFPLLRRIHARGFAHAIAFHGFSQAGVLIGGAAPLTLKQQIAAALKAALAGSGIQVRIADPSEHYDGDSTRNLVNRLTAGGANGVQIEQSLQAREEYGQVIADAVARVYLEECLAPAPTTATGRGTRRRGRAVPTPRRARRVE